MNCCGNDAYSLFSSENSSYGEKYQYDPDFKGPKSRRSPTDIYWLWAFLVFTIVWLTFGICVLLNDPDNAHRLNLSLSPSESEVFAYLKKTLWCFVGPILVASVICLVLIYVMRWIATPVVWFSIFLLIAVFMTFAIAGFCIYFEKSSNPNSSTGLQEYGKRDDDASSGLATGIGFSIITVIAAIGVYFLQEKIVVAIALIKESSKAVASAYSTVFFPIAPLLLQIGVFAMGISVAMNIQFFTSLDNDGAQVALHLLNFFGAFWAYLFIDAFEKMVLAHTFSAWYWTFDKKDVPFFTLTTAVVRTTKYHMGTVALGSFIIFVAKLVCYMIKAMMNNRYARVLRLCCDITDVIERFIQFLNKNTYIMVAIHGNPFCQSMRDAFNLLMRNIASVYVTNKVTALQFGIFNIAIASGMGGLTYLFLPVADTEAQSNLIMYPIFVSVIGSSIVAATFFGVYSMAIDTLFLCFLEDCERNDGTEERPYYMSPELMRVLHKNHENLLPPRYEV